MSARSRKRGRRERRPGSPGPGHAPAPAPATPPTDTVGTAYRRGEERNERIRATLTPLEPGERPWALRIAIVLAVLVGIGDLIQLAIGGAVKFGKTGTSIPGTILFSILMLVCAGGMWQLRYWALLGFQALLALVVIAFSLVLVDSTDVLRAVIAIAVIAAGGTLFFKLVRVLSRLQLPSRPGQP